MEKPTPVLISRILFAAGLLSACGATYWFLRTSFAPVEVILPPPVTANGNLRFDPTADVSKNPEWDKLRPLIDGDLETTQIGRANPFVPVATTTNSAGSVPIQEPTTP